MGTVFVQGTATTANVVKILPKLDEAGLNVKIVAAISPQLFALQDETYRASVATAADRLDAMVISNRARRVMSDWIDHPIVAEYSLTSDWDDRWRTGGTVDEVIAEAHLCSGAPPRRHRAVRARAPDPAPPPARDPRRGGTTLTDRR